MRHKAFKTIVFFGVVIILAAGCKKKETVKLYTDEATQITSNSAVVSGEVKSDVRLDELGVCYGTSANPTVNDKTKTVDSDLSTFSCKLTNLQEGKTYHARTYAVTTNGNTYYGDEVGWVAQSTIPPYIIALCFENTITDGGTSHFSIAAYADTTSQKVLSTIKIEAIYFGESVYSLTENINAAMFAKVYELSFQGENGDEFEVIFTVTDDAGLSSSSYFTITIVEPVLEERFFTWERIGSNPGTGLAEFGLEWTGNASKAIYAVIKPMANAKLYQLTSAVYTEATTESQKVAAFENATEIVQWKEFNVAGAASQTFDVVLGTVYNGVYSLIHITNGTYESNSAGTHATITGLAK